MESPLTHQDNVDTIHNALDYIDRRLVHLEPEVTQQLASDISTLLEYMDWHTLHKYLDD